MKDNTVLLCVKDDEARRKLAIDFRKRGIGVFEVATPNAKLDKLRVHEGNPLRLVSIVITEKEAELWEKWITRLSLHLPLTTVKTK